MTQTASTALTSALHSLSFASRLTNAASVLGTDVQGAAPGLYRTARGFGEGTLARVRGQMGARSTQPSSDCGRTPGHSHACILLNPVAGPNRQGSGTMADCGSQ